MRLLLAASLLALSSAAMAQSPPSIVTQPTKLDADLAGQDAPAL